MTELRQASGPAVGHLATNWWAVAVRGLLAVLFGIATFLVPALTLAGLALLFGAYAIVEGVFNLIAAVRGLGAGQPWWALVIEGLASIAAGIVTFAVPALTTLVLLYVIAAWAIVTGVFEIVAAVRLRARIENEWWLGLSGVLSIAFGVLIMAYPGAGALAVVLWIGAYAVVFGAMLIALAFRLRSRHGAQPAQLRRAA